MSNNILGNVAGGGAFTPKSFVLEDENGISFIGVTVGEETVLTATDEDVKIGKVFASDDGVSIGKDTRTYRTKHGTRLVLPGENFSVVLDKYDAYDYTGFQAMISSFNTTEFDSVLIEKIALYDAVYAVNSDSKLSDVTKNSETQSVDLNFVNNTDGTYIIHFNTYKEE